MPPQHQQIMKLEAQRPTTFQRAMGKARSAGVSASSFLDLKAELSKAEDEFKKAKASGSGGRAEPIVGGVKREGKVVIRILTCTI